MFNGLSTCKLIKNGVSLYGIIVKTANVIEYSTFKLKVKDAYDLVVNVHKSAKTVGSSRLFKVRDGHTEGCTSITVSDAGHTE